MWHSQMKSGSAHCDLELPTRRQKEDEKEKEEKEKDKEKEKDVHPRLFPRPRLRARSAVHRSALLQISAARGHVTQGDRSDGGPVTKVQLQRSKDLGTYLGPRQSRVGCRANGTTESDGPSHALFLEQDEPGDLKRGVLAVSFLLRCLPLRLSHDFLLLYDAWRISLLLASASGYCPVMTLRSQQNSWFAWFRRKNCSRDLRWFESTVFWGPSSEDAGYEAMKNGTPPVSSATWQAGKSPN
eukprot:s4004_g7.t1